MLSDSLLQRVVGTVKTFIGTLAFGTGTLEYVVATVLSEEFPQPKLDQHGVAGYCV